MQNFKWMTKPPIWFMALLLTVLTAGCNGGAGGGAPILGLPDVVSLTVTPATASIPVTGTQQYTAIATYSDGSSRDVTASSSWSAASGGVSMLAAPGHATGVTANVVPVVITATFGDRTATANLTVTPATSVSFVVTPTTASIPLGGVQQFAAIQTFSDGTTIDRTAASAWTKSGASALNATLSADGASGGLATGVTATPVGAPVIINATFGALVATPATLIVTPATSVSFVVTPATATIPVGGVQQYTAIQTFSDGTTIDRTAASTWTKSAASALNATLSANGVSGGLATGVTATPVGAPVIINATFGALSATPASLTVNAATSVSFVVIPATATMPVGGTQQYTAIQTFSDGTTIDRTAASAWTSIDVAPAIGVATLSVNGVTGGLVTGNAVGASNINATFGALVATPASLTVTAATVTSINVTPAAASILVGASQQYTATAILSDGSSLDVTANIGTLWASATPGVAANPVNGLTSGLTAGTSNITASYGGKTSPLPPAAGAAVLTVTAPDPGPAGPAPELGLVASHGLIAWDAITNSAGPSHIYGDAALTQPGPGGTIASVTGPGFNDVPGVPLASNGVTNSTGVTPGVIVAANNGMLDPQLLIDLRALFDDLMLRAPGPTALTDIASAAGVGGGTFAAATDLSGYVLSPGVYATAASYGLSNVSGPLVLDAGGNPDAVFVIRSTNAVSGITSTTGSVVLQGGALAKNVFWVVEDATVGGGTFFQGTVVAGHTITLLGFANVQGRTLAGARGLASGALTLTSTNIITVPQ